MKELRYRGHIAGLDVLRGVAISLVMVYHGIDARAPWQEFVGFQRWVYYLTQWGSTGVHLFFILSGFLITGIIIDSPQRPGFYKRFYFNRTVRIIPAYLLILALLKITHHIGWRYIFGLHTLYSQHGWFSRRLQFRIWGILVIGSRRAILSRVAMDCASVSS